MRAIGFVSKEGCPGIQALCFRVVVGDALGWVWGCVGEETAENGRRRAYRRADMTKFGSVIYMLKTARRTT
jgi:hypothetical protein